MKKLLLAVLILILSLQFVAAVTAQAREVADFIGDNAGVLSTDTINRLNTMAWQLESATGAQIVVRIIPSLDGEPMDDWTFNYANTHQIGDAQRDNGILLAIAVAERETRIEVGRGLEGALPDGKVGRIQDEFLIPYLRDGNYNAGVENTFRVLLTEIALEYDVEIDGAMPQSPVSGNRGTNWIELIILIALFGGFFPFFMMRGRRGGRGGGMFGPPPPGGFGGGMGGMGGRGGFGGGMGGGFRGGGGGFGGGGAGRRF